MTPFQVAATLYAVGTTLVFTIPIWRKYQRVDLAVASYFWPVICAGAAVLMARGEGRR